MRIALTLLVSLNACGAPVDHKGDTDAGDTDATGADTDVADTDENGTCASPSDCSGDQAYIEGACVDPVPDPAMYGTTAAMHPASYLWSLRSPAQDGAPDSCCFDYNGDALSDDAIGGLLEVASAFSPDSVLGPATLVRDTVGRVVEWRQLPADGGVVALSMFPATSDVDGDGAPDASLADRAAGMGAFALEPLGFGEYGAQIQDSCATRVADSVFGDMDLLDLRLVLVGVVPIPLRLHDVRFAANLSEQPDGVHTVDVWTDADESAPCLSSADCPAELECDASTSTCRAFTGGGMLGGVVLMEEMFGAIDESLRACDCAGVDPLHPVVTWTLAEDGYDITCTENRTSAEACDETDPPVCASLDAMCSALSLITSIADVDTDEDGVNDGFSVGLRFGLTGAAIDGIATE